jgi:hypothetical protein
MGFPFCLEYVFLFLFSDKDKGEIFNVSEFFIALKLKSDVNFGRLLNK